MTHDWADFKRWGNAVIELENVSNDELKWWQRTAVMEFELQPRVLLYSLKRFIRGEHEKFFYRPLLFAISEYLDRKLPWRKKRRTAI